jgi:hypothetical protein
MSNNFFRQKSCRLWDNGEEYGTSGQATDDNIMLPIEDAICMPSN